MLRCLLLLISSILTSAITSDRSCEELNWDFYNPSSRPYVCSSNSLDGNCAPIMSYNDAVLYCTQAGARLCTSDELKDNVSPNIGCNKRSARAWSVAPGACPQDNMYPSQGGTQIDLLRYPVGCVSSSASLEVRCCADSTRYEDNYSARSTSSCEDLQTQSSVWKTPTEKAGPDMMSRVCATSKINEQCPSYGVTYEEAFSICQTMGARICTAQELFSNAALSSGCKLDNKRVWSSSPCPLSSVEGARSNLMISHAGSGKTSAVNAEPAMCHSRQERFHVRCCADRNIPLSIEPPPQAQPQPLPEQPQKPATTQTTSTPTISYTSSTPTQRPTSTTPTISPTSSPTLYPHYSVLAQTLVLDIVTISHSESEDDSGSDSYTGLDKGEAASDQPLVDIQLDPFREALASIYFVPLDYISIISALPFSDAALNSVAESNTDVGTNSQQIYGSFGSVALVDYDANGDEQEGADITEEESAKKEEMLNAIITFVVQGLDAQNASSLVGYMQDPSHEMQLTSVLQEAYPELTAAVLVSADMYQDRDLLQLLGDVDDNNDDIGNNNEEGGEEQKDESEDSITIATAAMASEGETKHGLGGGYVFLIILIVLLTFIAAGAAVWLMLFRNRDSESEKEDKAARKKGETNNFDYNATPQGTGYNYNPSAPSPFSPVKYAPTSNIKNKSNGSFDSPAPPPLPMNDNTTENHDGHAGLHDITVDVSTNNNMPSEDAPQFKNFYTNTASSATTRQLPPKPPTTPLNQFQAYNNAQVAGTPLTQHPREEAEVEDTRFLLQQQQNQSQHQDVQGKDPGDGEGDDSLQTLKYQYSADTLVTTAGTMLIGGDTMKEGEAMFVTGLYDYAGTDEGDLIFKKGDVIKVLSTCTEEGEEWWLGEVTVADTTHRGVFPRVYTDQGMK